MKLLYYRLKTASAPEMGNALHTVISPVNHDEGRLHFRTTDNPTQQVSSAFSQNQNQLLLDGFNESNQIPTGAWQSKTAVNVEELSKLSPVPVRTDPRAERYGGGYFAGDHIGVTENPNINTLAHEIGHAQLNKSLFGKIIQSKLSRGAHSLGPLAALFMGPNVQGKGAPRALKALLIGLGLSAPTLLSEGMSSYKGYKNLQNAGATDDELKTYTRDLIGPQSTYLIRPALSAASIYYPYKKNAGYALDRRTTFRGLNISIETDKGNYRYWYDPNNKTEGKTLMKYPYGYIRRTEGLDGDHVDCFIGPNENAKNVFVITTNKAPDFDKTDEQKCMLGFDSAKDAKDAFLDSYTDKRFFQKMDTLSFDDFKDKVLATFDSSTKKISTELIEHGPGTFNDQTPGDYLGFPATSLVGLRKIVGDPMSPQNKIDKAFRFNDLNTDMRVLDNSANSVASSPGV